MGEGWDGWIRGGVRWDDWVRNRVVVEWVGLGKGELGWVLFLKFKVTEEEKVKDKDISVPSSKVQHTMVVSMSGIHAEFSYGGPKR